MIGIVNYGLGNVQAFANIYKRLNIPASIVSRPDELRLVEKIILPGVGAFDWAMRRLEESGLRSALEGAVRQGRPVLGVCVGMQMMAERSEEGVLEGLGWIDGEVRRFGDARMNRMIGMKEDGGMRLPHMGWNDVRPVGGNGLFKGLEEGARFYFLHSYYFAPGNQAEVIGVTDYYGEYASAVCAGNVVGVQFHPEKSHGWGIQLLKNFADPQITQIDADSRNEQR